MAQHGIPADAPSSRPAVRCSFKKATAFICAFNFVGALFVLQTLLGPVHIGPRSSSPGSKSAHLHRRTVIGYSAEEANRVQESNEIRRAVEPHDLIERVKEIEHENLDVGTEGISNAIMEKVALELSQRLEDLQILYNQSNQKAVDEWPKKLANWNHAVASKIKRSVDPDNIARSLAEEEVARLLELGWESLLRQVISGAPIPSEAPKTDADADGDGTSTVLGPEIEDGIIPGRTVPEECHAEAHSDYDGVAVRWGLTHHTESAADCCQACIDQARGAKPGEKKCNIWVFCPAENGCFSPDIYEHKHQECWLKQSDKPHLNFKGHYEEEYRHTHPTAPVIVPWVSGVVGGN